MARFTSRFAFGKVADARKVLVHAMVGIGLFCCLAVPSRAATLNWVGVNMPWLSYGSSFGSGYNATTADGYLNEIKYTYHCNFVRIWLCEGLAGLSFNGSGSCTGISSTNLSHITDFVARASNKGLTVDCVFINYMDVQQHPTYISNQTNANNLIWNGFIPIVKAVKGYNVVFDLINEANLSTNAVSWSALRWFGNTAVNAAHNQGVYKWITMSDQNASDYTNSFSSTVGGLGFDWYDYHSYDSNGYLGVTPANVGNKPLMLGEFGPSSNWQGRSDSANQATIDAFMNNASSKGYQGASAWCYLNDGSGFGLRGRNQMYNIQWWSQNFGH